MAANTAPRYTLIANTSPGKIALTGNTARDSSGTSILIFTADATDGSRVSKIRCCTLGTNTASNIMIWLNNGSAAGPTTSSLIADVTLPGTTVSQVAGQTPVDIVLDIDMPASYRLYATVGTTMAIGWNVSAFGGDFS